LNPSIAQTPAADQLTNMPFPYAQLPAFGSLPSSKPLQPSRRDLVSRLDECTREIFGLCRDTGGGQTLWPDDKLLDDISTNIRALASLYKHDPETIWQCIIALQSRRKTVLKLRKSIEALVDRASNFLSEPEAIRIQRQGIAGNESAKRCYEDLKKCRDGQSKIASVDWDQYHDILSPRSNEGCHDRATQILIDWLRWKPDSKAPWGSLDFWLLTNCNRDLLSKLVNPDSVNPFETILVDRKRNRIKQGNVIRQKKCRLRKRRLALSQRLRSERRGLHELVRHDLKIIDSCNSTENERLAAAGRLIHYTRRTPEEWRRFFVKKA